VAIRSPINPQTIVRERQATMPAAMNFISGGSPLGSSIVSSAANKIVGFQRGASSVAPRTPDLGSIIQTLSSNILNNVETRLQSINQNVSNVVNQTLRSFGKDYQDRVKQIDDAKPTGILANFLKLYQQAIGFIQFLGNRKNVKTLGDNLQVLQRIFTETFEVAKIIRQTIVKIVKQLSNLPTASTGGGGLNLDIKVPGGPLKRSAPKGAMNMLKMAGAGAAIAGAGALGTKAVSGMMDVGGEEVQAVPGSGSEGLSGPILDRFNAILERFDAAISSMTKKPAAAPRAPAGGGGGAAESETPPPSSPPGPSPGGAVATGSEQQKTEALIAGEEGVRLQAYQNPGDVPTIGYGQTKINGRSVRLGDTMTKEQATAGLRSNIESHRARAVRDIGKESWDNIKDENSKAVLTSLAYNYGHVPSSVVVAAKTGDPKKIADAVRGLSDPSNKSYDSRLIGRRNREADFIMSGKIQKADKDFLPGGKLAAPGTVPSTTVTTTPAKPGVAAASTPATTTQQIAQTVSQPAQQQPQVTVLPMAMNAGSTPPPPKPPSSGGSPAPNMTSGRMLPSLSSANHDNFLTLYSKMVYNIVDG
jgi:GH24 family phage-related lysozyme (muramidase)